MRSLLRRLDGRADGSGFGGGLFEHVGHQASNTDAADEFAGIFSFDDGEAFEAIFAHGGGGDGAVVGGSESDWIFAHELAGKCAGGGALRAGAEEIGDGDHAFEGGTIRGDVEELIGGFDEGASDIAQGGAGLQERLRDGLHEFAKSSSFEEVVSLRLIFPDIDGAAIERLSESIAQWGEGAGDLGEDIFAQDEDFD